MGPSMWAVLEAVEGSGDARHTLSCNPGSSILNLLIETNEHLIAKLKDGRKLQAIRSHPLTGRACSGLQGLPLPKLLIEPQALAFKIRA